MEFLCETIAFVIWGAIWLAALAVFFTAATLILFLTGVLPLV